MASVSMGSVSYVGDSTVRVTGTVYGLPASGSVRVYISFRNENSSYKDFNSMYTTVYNPTNIEGINRDFEVTSITCGYLSNDTTWHVSYRCGGSISDEAQVYMPFEGVIPSDFIINERPTQQTQNVVYNGVLQGEAGSCVANTLASVKNIQELRNGKTVLDYSVMWLFGGAGNGTTEGLQFEDALSFLKNNGIPPYQVINNTIGVSGYPDVAYQRDAKNVYAENNTAEIRGFALPQKIGGFSPVARSADSLGFYNQVIDAIKSNTVMITMNIDKSLDDAASNGIVGGIVGSIRDGHAMVLLGIKTINGKKHWVAQNSWTYSNGSPMGDNGLYYIPFSWFSFDWCGINGFYIIEDDQNAPPLPPIPSVLRPPYVKKMWEGMVDLAWDKYLNSTNYELRLRCEDGTSYYYQTSNTEYRCTNLKYGYKYWASVRAYNGGKWTNFSDETKFISPPLSISIKNIKSTTDTNLIITLDPSSVSGKFSGYNVRRNPYPYVNNPIDYKVATTTNASVEWAGLQNGSKWSFNTYAYLDVDGSRVWASYLSNHKDGVVGLKRPPYFYWDNEKSKGSVFDVKASEWNRLSKNCEDLLKFKQAKGDENVNPSAHTFTTTNPNDKVLASIYNEVRNCLVYWSGLDTGYDIKSARNYDSTVTYSTKEILASELMLIQEAINSVE